MAEEEEERKCGWIHLKCTFLFTVCLKSDMNVKNKMAFRAAVV